MTYDLRDHLPAISLAAEQINTLPHRLPDLVNKRLDQLPTSAL